MRHHHEPLVEILGRSVPQKRCDDTGTNPLSSASSPPLSTASSTNQASDVGGSGRCWDRGRARRGRSNNHDRQHSGDGEKHLTKDSVETCRRSTMNPRS